MSQKHCNSDKVTLKEMVKLLLIGTIIGIGLVAALLFLSIDQF